MIQIIFGIIYIFSYVSQNISSLRAPREKLKQRQNTHNQNKNKLQNNNMASLVICQLIQMSTSPCIFFSDLLVDWSKLIFDFMKKYLTYLHHIFKKFQCNEINALTMLFLIWSIPCLGDRHFRNQNQNQSSSESNANCTKEMMTC